MARVHETTLVCTYVIRDFEIFNLRVVGPIIYHIRGCMQTNVLDVPTLPATLFYHICWD
jgi:hypothetical protein